MKHKILYEKFNQAINWNLFLYVLHKGLHFFLSILLLKSLSSREFSLWANINCTTFLLLLWIDFGFRKSLPTFCPEFSKNKRSMKLFIRLVVLFQATVLTAAAPLFLFLTRTLKNGLGCPGKNSLIKIGCLFFFVEGIIAILRLIYHSYFWHKKFNLLISVILIMEMSTVLLLISMIDTSETLLINLFVIKIVGGGITIVAALFMLPSLFKDKNYPEVGEVDFKKTGEAFIKHSGIMWANNNVRSLTERNFLVPLFTYLLGPIPANIFKVTNDGALFFQRIVLKTIGTTDTSILAHAKNEKFFAQAFTTLTTKVTALCFPLLGIITVFFFGCYRSLQDHPAFTLFFVLTMCYLLHALLSSYERTLEVRKKYKKLFIGYSPYFIIIILFFLFWNNIPSIGLFLSVLIVHAVRLVSTAVMIHYARTQFDIHFPTRFALLVFAKSIMFGFVLYLCFIFIIKPLIPLSFLSSFFTFSRC